MKVVRYTTIIVSVYRALHDGMPFPGFVHQIIKTKLYAIFLPAAKPCRSMDHNWSLCVRASHFAHWCILRPERHGGIAKSDFLGKVTSQEKWLPGKIDFLGKVTSREKWPPGKVTSREKWLPGKSDFPGEVTSWEKLFSGNSDFWGKVTSPEKWILGKCDLLEEFWLPGKSHFFGNLTFKMLFTSSTSFGNIVEM